ncbi:MAG TPA: PaaX family transcriptional regulator C-terminal domain-containing protein [Acidimicrobiales bacterium]|nr:PaaX family transcriptional regulator C-terminal domain-containing protein [Acidimicrobiales bacterium]
MGKTTGPIATDLAAPVSSPGIAGGDLPTRMLVLGLARHDGSILAADAFPVADACGRSPEQVRSCLRRLVAEGLFTRQGQGQRAAYRATEAGLAALGASTARARLAHIQDAAARAWDRRWHLAAFAVPEARRAARDALRDHLVRLGGAAIHNGLYASPHPWEKDVNGEAERLDVSDHVTLAATDDLAVGGVSEPTALAARLWPIERLAARYQAFVDRWGHVPGDLASMRRRHQTLPDSAFLPGALAMGLAYQDCFDDDPLLPPELLPHPWPGGAARDLLVRSRRLALEIRAEHNRPALFRSFDDLIDALA